MSTTKHPRALLEWAKGQEVEIIGKSKDGLSALYQRADGTRAIADRMRMPGGEKMDVLACDIKTKDGVTGHVHLDPNGPFSEEPFRAGSSMKATYFQLLASMLESSPHAAAEAGNVKRLLEHIAKTRNLAVKADGEDFMEVAHRVMPAGGYFACKDELSRRIVSEIISRTDPAQLSACVAPMIRHANLTLLCVPRSEHRIRSLHTIGSAAAMTGHADSMDAYLKAGGPPNRRGATGLTLLEQCLLNGHEKASALLKAAGAKTSKGLGTLQVAEREIGKVSFDREKLGGILGPANESEQSLKL